jgi:hypothetical protein
MYEIFAYRLTVSFRSMDHVEEKLIADLIHGPPSNLKFIEIWRADRLHI